MKSSPNKVGHGGMVTLSLLVLGIVIIALVMPLVSSQLAFAAELQMTAPEQDGYTNDHEYNNTDTVLLCGQNGYVVVMEFPLSAGLTLRKAQLILTISRVKKPGRVALAHLLNFNNGYAETQDFYAATEKMGEQWVEKAGPIVFDVTKAVKRDAQGPGGFTSYRLQSEGAEIMLPAMESGTDGAHISVE